MNRLKMDTTDAKLTVNSLKIVLAGSIVLFRAVWSYGHIFL